MEKMDCKKDVKTRLLGYYYGEISPHLLNLLEEHLEGCKACRWEWERIKATLDAIEREVLTLPEGFWRGYNQKVYERIDRKGRWRGVFSYPRLVPSLVVSVLLIIAIFGGLRIKEVREERALVQDYAFLQNLDLLQDFELIQHLDEIEAITREGV